MRAFVDGTTVNAREIFRWQLRMFVLKSIQFENQISSVLCTWSGIDHLIKSGPGEI